MSSPAHVTTHAADALALLTSSTQGRTNIEAIVRAIGNRVQDLEEALWAAIQAVQLANGPVGVWLDALGEIAGEPRLNRGDVDYLLAVKVGLRANRSRGTAEDIIQILTLLGVTFSYSEDPYAPLEWRVDVYGVANFGPGIIRPLTRAKMGASRGLIASSDTAKIGTLVWDTNTWGSTTSPSTAYYKWGSLVEAK